MTWLKSPHIYENIYYNAKEHQWYFAGNCCPAPTNKNLSLMGGFSPLPLTPEKEKEIHNLGVQILETPYVISRIIKNCLWHIIMDNLYPVFFTLDFAFKGGANVLWDNHNEMNSLSFPHPYNNWQPWLKLISNESKILQNFDGWVLFRKLAFSNFAPSYTPTISNKKIEILNEKFSIKIIDSMGLNNTYKPKDKKKVLFINRSNNPIENTKRRVLNGEEAVNALQKENIDVTYAEFENLPLEKQVELSINSDIIVGPEGAALTHAMFMKERSKLLVIFPDHYKDCLDIYWLRVAVNYNLEYHKFIGEPFKDKYNIEETGKYKKILRVLPHLNDEEKERIRTLKNIFFNGNTVSGDLGDLGDIDHLDQTKLFCLKDYAKNLSMEIDIPKFVDKIKELLN